MEANSEREKRPRKMGCRELTNQPSSSSSEPVQTEKEIDLLPDIHNEILRKLWAGGEETLETLHTCRLVSREWEEFIDKLPPRLFWSPYIKHQSHDISDCVDIPTTDLASDFHIYQFLMGLPQQDDSVGDTQSNPNPFQFGQTVKLCDITERLKNREKLLTIIEKYGHHIKQLLYKPVLTVTETLGAVPNLLQSMTNLRTLIIVDFDYLFMVPMRKKAIRVEDFPELSHLRELVILNKIKMVDENHLERDTIYPKLGVKYGTQIKSLTVSNLILLLDPKRSHIMSKFPNLEDLKLEQSVLRGKTTAQPLPKLKRLALGLPDVIENVTGFSDMLILISCFSETLEVLSFDVQFYKKVTGDVRSRRGNVNTPMTLLKELVLPFWFMFRFPDKKSTLETRLGFKLSQLRRLVLQDDRRDGGFCEIELRKKCETLWTRVPPTVESIAVRTEKWNGRLQRNFPVFLKCHRNPVK